MERRRSRRPHRTGAQSTLFALVAAGVLCSSPRASAGEPQRPAAPLMGIDGSTGLVRIPTAEVIPYRFFALGLSKVDRRYRPYWHEDERGDSIGHYVTAGVLPRLEVTARFTNHDGKLGAQFRQDIKGGLGGWNFDRMFSAQVLLVPQGRRFPVSVAVGSQDVVGTGAFGARYLVISRRWPSLGLHVGTGRRRLGSLFGGVDFQPTPGVRLMLDHDGEDANLGAALRYHRLTITPILTGLEAFGGGIAYAFPI